MYIHINQREDLRRRVIDPNPTLMEELRLCKEKIRELSLLVEKPSSANTSNTAESKRTLEVRKGITHETNESRHTDINRPNS